MKTLRIVLTGADGSGKSTIAKLLAPMPEVSIWDALTPDTLGPTPFGSRAHAEQYLSTLRHQARTLFLMHALARAEERALRQPSKAILWNGYWYKYAASELAIGSSPECVWGAVAGFAKPDLVVCLDVSPETAWARRGTATAYEQGPASQAPSLQGKFIEFQKQVRKSWKEVEDRSGVPWVHLPETLTVEQKVEQIQKVIQEALRAGGEP